MPAFDTGLYGVQRLHYMTPRSENLRRFDGISAGLIGGACCEGECEVSKGASGRRGILANLLEDGQPRGRHG